MNFRTTILLLVVLVAAGVLYFVTQHKDSVEEQSRSGNVTDKKLIDIPSAGAVSKVVVASSAGERLVLERGSGASEWKLVEPVKGPAESFKVDELLRNILDLRSTGQTTAAGKGLDQPQYVVELTDKDNKTTTLNIGSRSSAGDMLFVRVGEGSAGDADIVSSAVVEQLEKPASEFRKVRLTTVPNETITGLTIAHDGKTLKLAKAGEQWQITEPNAMPGDAGQISSLLSSITSIDAVKFVSEDATSLGGFGLDQPQMTVSFSTTSATTQPTQPSVADTTTIKFGAPQDVLGKNVYAIASDTGPVVTVDATKLESLKKTPLDLRDRKVLEVKPDAVSKVTISTGKPATTQPTTQPATKREVVLERRSETPATAPTTAATTTPSTTQSTTAPATPPGSKWLVISDPAGDANDTEVQALLDGLQTLNAEKFLEQFPTTQAEPAAEYVVRVVTRAWADVPASEHELRLTDPGADAKLIGQIGGLVFELDRAILEKLTAEFAAPKVAPAGPVFNLPAPASPTVP